MKVMVMSDAHIVRDKKTNTYWCRTAVHGYEFWKRYLQTFDEVNVVARVQVEDSVDTQVCTRADGAGVSFTELPFIRGTKGYVLNYFKLRKIMKGLISDEACGIFRLPSLPTFMLLSEFKKTGRPYAIEVIVDPQDAYKSNKIAKILMTQLLKSECRKANGVSYVTEFYLEQKYPSYSILHGESDRFFNSYYSSIKLDQSFFGEPKDFADLDSRAINIIHMASAINSDVKGHTTLLSVMQMLNNKGIPFTLRCIGDGDRRQYYENMANELGIQNKVRFLGLFSKKEDLRKELINSDIMVFPSQAEGLPRVVIEAMAVGLPCLSTPINGIPELIEEQYLFDPFDVNGFANKIIELKNNPKEMNEMSCRNIKKAHEYEDGILQKRRAEFYAKLRNLVQS